MRRLVASLLMLAGASGQAWAASETCQAAWEHVERVRVELGLRPGPATAPADPLRPEIACQAILDTPAAELRRHIRESIEICGGDCRDLSTRGERK